MHNYLMKVYITIVFCVIYTPIGIDIFVSSSGSYNHCLAKVHTVFQLQLLIIKL